MTYNVIRQHGAQVQTMAGRIWINTKSGAGDPLSKQAAEKIASDQNRRARPAQSIAPYWLYMAVAAENKNRPDQTTTTKPDGKETPLKHFNGLLNYTIKGDLKTC